MCNYNKCEVAYTYMYAVKGQQEKVAVLNEALNGLGSGNYISETAKEIEEAYTDLVSKLLGPHLSDWLSWYMWEADFGKKNLLFFIDEIEYDPSKMSFVEFWNVIQIPNAE